MNFKWSWFIYWTCPSRAEAPTTQVGIDEINFFSSLGQRTSSCLSTCDICIGRYKQEIPFDSRLNKWKEEATDRKKKNNENKLTKFVDIQFLISFVGYVLTLRTKCLEWDEIYSLTSENFIVLMRLLFGGIINPLAPTWYLTCSNRLKWSTLLSLWWRSLCRDFCCAKSAGKRTIILCSNNVKSTFYGCLSRLQRWDFRNSVRISRA